MPTHVRGFSLFTQGQYYEQLAADAPKTKRGDRLVVATMTFKPEKPGLQPMLDGLAQAARNGANIRLVIDAFTFLINNARPGPLWFFSMLPKHISRVYQRRLEALRKLEGSGGHYTIINWPKRPLKNPFGDRSHLKFAVINDYLYLGGCNLNPRDHIDIMVGWRDQRTSDWLYEIANKIAQKGSVKQALKSEDIQFKVDDQNTIFMDAGIKHQSIIFEKAMQLIDEAEETIFMTCQYFPNSTTTRHLADAVKRGVNVKLVYGHPDQHPFPYNVLHRSVARVERLRNPASLFQHGLPKGSPSLHAKVLVSEKAAMVGSHNYVTAGVKWGTAEISLHSTDLNLGNALQKMIAKQVSEC